MPNFLKKVLELIKRHPFLASLGALIIIIFLFFLVGKRGVERDFIIVEKKDLTEIIEATGRVRAAQSVNLGFEKSGRVGSVNVKIGEQVFSGATLASLENGDIRADLLQAEANLKAEEAKLDELKGSGRPEDIAIAEAGAEKAEAYYNDAKEGFFDSIRGAFVKIDDAIRNKADQFFSNPQSSIPALAVKAPSSQLKIDVESARVGIETALKTWEKNLSDSGTADNLTEEKETADLTISAVKNFLDKMALIINSLKPDSEISQTTIDAYKADIFTARTNAGAADSDIASALLNLNDKYSELEIARNELSIKIIGGAPEQIRFQEAKVDAGRASVARFQAELLKTLIRAPFSGLVGKIDLKKGETVSLGESLISLVSDKSYEIEINIAEADIAGLEIGQKASLTLDAYSKKDVFEATIDSINPSETIIEGVPTYETILRFDKEDPRIKPGMTADLEIITAEKEGALSVPRRAILDNDGKKYLRILDGENVEMIEVETGISGRDAEVEIVSGLREGDKVITSIEE